MRDKVKAGLGAMATAAIRQADYGRCIFVLAHMRCGSTALSNILCSRSDVSGYGETHVRHDSPTAPGRLVVNLALRRAWSPRADRLFDKILHTRLDADPPSAFFSARAIFVVRPPDPTIRSIRRLFERLGRPHDYPTDEAAARYYVDRLRHLCALWDGFPAGRRIGLTHSQLLSDPDAALARISARLAIAPPLENRYVSPVRSRIGGGGDPLASARHTRIEPAREARAEGPADIDEALAACAAEAYERLVDRFTLD
ncbi:sulfotransferase family protein [Wenxinia marina]|uniref:Sulfotransferase family n=1 Tax=Wenxinia marina DSM 24838 TaxID=1123501 RepID=A0A0D0Q9R8_9RHOB|nr:sulfotransferase [Wenxinia marina]KIQ67763.1 Sulfotransferase family [Wenxinia marina DSM 24838]GGL77437.1 hypothetical protein GCM10011392_34830 [Wenxinia marina]